MKRAILFTVAFAITASLLLTGCGAVSPTNSANTSAFINRTNMPEEDFQTLAESKWKEAQVQTSSQWIDLWAAYRAIANEPAGAQCYTGQLQCDGFIPPIPETASLGPYGIVVLAVPDVLAGSNTPNHPTNPTGIFPCHGGTGYCQAYVVFDPCNISVPASAPGNMGPYEMQNCMLQRLGYDVSRR